MMKRVTWFVGGVAGVPPRAMRKAQGQGQTPPRSHPSQTAR